MSEFEHSIGDSIEHIGSYFSELESLRLVETGFDPSPERLFIADTAPDIQAAALDRYTRAYIAGQHAANLLIGGENQILQQEVRFERQLRTEAERSARYDKLTGLQMKQVFDERVTRFVMGHSRAEDLDEDVTNYLLLVDLDFFKSINDVYGHPTGDEVLRATGAVLLNSFRDEDEIGRLGGEEFGAFIKRVSPDMLIKIVERCQRQIRGIDFRSMAEQSSKLAEQPPAIREALLQRKITASIGVAPLPRGGSYLEAYSSADLALYHAKESGRDTAYARLVLENRPVSARVDTPRPT